MDKTISAVLGSFLESLRHQLCAGDFMSRHRVRAVDFTRQRQLTFPVVMLFTLQKTVRSLQRHLHEFLDELAGGELFEPVSAGAFTHARAKLKHTAFIELNQACVLPAVYGQEPVRPLQFWKGHRLLGVDSSVVRLPEHPHLFEQFSAVTVVNQGGQTGTRYPEGRISVLYDLLNRIGLDARLEPSRTGEVELAIEQLAHAAPGDVLISDRGFTGYRYLAEQHRRGLNYVARCSSSSFAPAQDLFRRDRAGRSMVVKLFAPPHERVALRAAGLPLELKVRFVSVRLPTGELEVLATSLLGREKYPVADFLQLYHRRWNHETFYLVLKSRLELENFSGHTPEAVRQDFHSTMLLCNLESVLTATTDIALQEHSADHAHAKQVNRADSFHAIKHQLLPLLYSELPTSHVIAKLQSWFAGAPVSVRPNRKIPRHKPSLSRAYHFLRRVKKTVF